MASKTTRVVAQSASARFEDGHIEWIKQRLDAGGGFQSIAKAFLREHAGFACSVKSLANRIRRIWSDMREQRGGAEAAADAMAGLPLFETTAAMPEAPRELMQQAPVRRWTRRESLWLVAHITKEKLATGKRIGNWDATARAFKDEFGYARSEKSFATQAARLRAEPERLQRQPRERQADGVASDRPPEMRKKRAVQPQPRDWRREQQRRDLLKQETGAEVFQLLGIED
jgi:hypothetical protein